MEAYNHKNTEKKWQKRWEKEGIYRISEDQGLRIKSRKGKCYVLDMFPYPSGDGLHVGHPKGYIATDVYSRMKKMQGYEILHPMGWDAFGLPAENYALKNKIHPRVVVEKNIKRFKEQLSLLGFNYDWEREINTTDPEFYKWTQWIFLQMFKKGLVYQSYEPINWCPSCKTGLANEDLDGGKCERCGAVVEKKPMRQWVLKITDYAERLLEGLEGLDWPESIKESQRNWIGRSEGAEIEFKIKDQGLRIKVFTTRSDTLFGTTYLVLAPEHPLLQNLEARIKNLEEVQKYLNETKKRTEQDRVAEDKEKTGVELRGIKAINPANGEEIPVFVADYVLGWYGTGAIMAVPAHDERDFEFAKKYKLPIREAVKFQRGSSTSSETKETKKAYEGDGVLVNSGKFDGMDSEEAKWKITEFIGGKKVTKYKLRDWVFSRQRYWGEPIPLVFCENCKKSVEDTSVQYGEVRPSLSLRESSAKPSILGRSDFDGNAGELLNPGWVAVPEEELPVKLPEVKHYEPTGTGESPLANIKEWVNTKCPKCGGDAKRETNTMPQWAGSSWYYIAYAVCKISKSESLISKQSQNSKFQIQNKKMLDHWLPVDMYVGGAEHATRHLIYARFWHKFLFDLGVVFTDEPFTRLQHVGLIGGADGRKMSKRYGNVINPDDVVATFGADTLRLYEMFMGPFDGNIPWSEEGILGPRRFLERVWRLGISNSKFLISKQSQNPKFEIPNKLERLLHRTIKKVTEDIEGFRFNTAISAMMIFFNEIEKNQNLEVFLKLLFPFAPHITEEIWREVLEHKTSLYLEPWPEWDEKLIQGDAFQLVVQINGKARATIVAEMGISQDEVEKLARADTGVLKHLEGKKVSRIVFVKDKLMNFVLDKD